MTLSEVLKIFSGCKTDEDIEAKLKTLNDTKFMGVLWCFEAIKERTICRDECRELILEELTNAT